MSRRALSAFLEACHEGPADLTGWCHALVETMPEAIGAHAGVAISLADRARMRRAVVAGVGAAGELAAEPDSGSCDVEAQRLFRAAYRPFRVALGSQHAGRSGLDGLPLMRQLYPGFEDVLGMMLDSGSRPLVVSMPLRASESHLSPRNARLRRIQRHLAGAALRRRDRGWHATAELILHEGRVAHATPAAAALRPKVEAAARALADGLSSDDDACREAEALWDNLWRGGWTVVNLIDDANRRLLVVRRVKSAAGRPRLTRAERAVVGLTARGCSLKVIAVDLGMSLGTASAHLTRALRKLGLADRTQLASLSSTDPGYPYGESAAR